MELVPYVTEAVVCPCPHTNNDTSTSTLGTMLRLIHWVALTAVVNTCTVALADRSG